MRVIDMSHRVHRSHQTTWLQAAVLGANDSIVSTASLVMGVAAAQATHQSILLAGTAGLIAGAMSMAPLSIPRNAASFENLGHGAL